MESLNITTNAALNEYAALLKSEGFTIIASNADRPTWFNFAQGNMIGYVEKASFGGYNFSCRHVPCKEYGSALSIERNAELTLSNAVRALARTGWGNSTTRAVKDYSTLDTFMSTAYNKGRYYIA